MPKGSGPRGGRQQAARARQEPRGELSPAVRQWWEILRRVADEPEVDLATLEEYARLSAGWDLRQLNDAAALLDLSVVRGDIAPQHARIILQRMRLASDALKSGALAATAPDVVGVAYVEAEHVVDPAHASDSLRERLVDPYGLSDDA